MRFYNKFDGPPKDFVTANICSRVGNRTEFSKVSYYPLVSTDSLWETLIGAMGPVVTQFIIDVRFTEINNTHKINGLYSCSEQPLSQMWSVKLFARLNTCLQLHTFLFWDRLIVMFACHHLPQP